MEPKQRYIIKVEISTLNQDKRFRKKHIIYFDRSDKANIEREKGRKASLKIGS